MSGNNSFDSDSWEISSVEADSVLEMQALIPDSTETSFVEIDPPAENTESQPRSFNPLSSLVGLLLGIVGNNAVEFSAAAVMTFFAFNRVGSQTSASFLQSLQRISPLGNCYATVLKSLCDSYSSNMTANATDCGALPGSIMDASNSSFISLSPFANWAAMTFVAVLLLKLALVGGRIEIVKNFNPASVVRTNKSMAAELQTFYFIRTAALLINLMMIFDIPNFNSRSATVSLVKQICADDKYSMDQSPLYYDSLVEGTPSAPMLALIMILMSLAQVIQFFWEEPWMIQRLRAEWNNELPVAPVTTVDETTAPPKAPLTAPRAPKRDIPRLTEEEVTHLKASLVEKFAKEAFKETYYCPVLKTLMLDPVTTSAGNTYSRSAIEKWLKDHSTDPTSNEAINNTLTPNNYLRAEIREAMEKAWGETVKSRCEKAATTIQRAFREHHTERVEAAKTIQLAWRDYHHKKALEQGSAQIAIQIEGEDENATEEPPFL